MVRQPRQARTENDQQYGEQETARRRDEWLRRSLATPPKQHKTMVAERKAKRDRQGGKRKK